MYFIAPPFCRTASRRLLPPAVISCRPGAVLYGEKVAAVVRTRPLEAQNGRNKAGAQRVEKRAGTHRLRAWRKFRSRCEFDNKKMAGLTVSRLNRIRRPSRDINPLPCGCHYRTLLPLTDRRALARRECPFLRSLMISPSLYFLLPGLIYLVLECHAPLQ